MAKSTLFVLSLSLGSFLYGDHHRYDDESVVIRLIEIASTSSNIDVKIDAMHRLEHIGDERAKDLLLKLTYDPNWEIRKRAIIALKFINDERAIQRLHELVTDDDPGNVIVATETLLLSTNEGDLSLIVEQLENKDPEIRLLAAESLWFIPRHGYLPEIQTALANEKDSTVAKQLRTVVKMIEKD